MIDTFWQQEIPVIPPYKPAPQVSTDPATGLTPPQEGTQPMPQPHEKREQFYAVKPMPQQFPDLPVAQS